MDKYANTHVRKYHNTQTRKYVSISYTVGSTVSTEDVEKNLFGQRCHSHRDKTISQIESNSLIFFLKGNIAYL